MAEADFTCVGGAVATRKLLGRHAEIDGIFAASDLMARSTVAPRRRASFSRPN
jgi:DNA-binding LacI/PurR family transcriptional regulator